LVLTPPASGPRRPFNRLSPEWDGQSGIPALVARIRSGGPFGDVSTPDPLRFASVNGLQVRLRTVAPRFQDQQSCLGSCGRSRRHRATHGGATHGGATRRHRATHGGASLPSITHGRASLSGVTDFGGTHDAVAHCEVVR
jgi:hypothetical protein